LGGQKDASRSGRLKHPRAALCRVGRVAPPQILCGKLAFRCPALPLCHGGIGVNQTCAGKFNYTLLWEGENPAFHEALLQELEESGIPYADKPIAEGEAQSDPLPIDWKPRFGFEVAVHQPDLPRSESDFREASLTKAKLADVELPDAEEEAEEESTP